MQRNAARRAGDPGSRLRRRAPALVMLLGLVVSPGCYTYHRAELPGLEPGEQVRVFLEDAGFSRYAPGAPAGAPRRLEGNFLRATEDSLAISVWIGEAYRGTPFEVAHQEFAIPRAEVVRVESRRLSPWRTAVAGAVMAAVIATLIDGIGLIEVFGGEDGDGELPSPPAPEGGTTGG